jgi:hypothetical protein
MYLMVKKAGSEQEALGVKSHRIFKGPTGYQLIGVRTDVDQFQLHRLT